MQRRPITVTRARQPYGGQLIPTDPFNVVEPDEADEEQEIRGAAQQDEKEYDECPIQMLDDIIATSSPEIRFVKTLQTLRISLHYYLKMYLQHDQRREETIKIAYAKFNVLLGELEKFVIDPYRFAPDTTCPTKEYEEAKSRYDAENVKRTTTTSVLADAEKTK